MEKNYDCENLGINDEDCENLKWNLEYLDNEDMSALVRKKHLEYKLKKLKVKLTLINYF